MSARWWRAMDREYNAFLRKRGDADAECMCPICYEIFDPYSECIAVTVCGHAFHGRCWSDYTRSRAPSSDTEDPRGAIATLLATYINGFGGPNCPECRQELPMVHHLAARLSDTSAKTLAEDQGIRDILTTDHVLKIAHMRFTS